MSKKQNRKKLQYWQEQLAKNESAYEGYYQKIDRREELFRGDPSVSPCTDNDEARESYHVRNIVSELIESQVDATVPAPKVTPRRAEDEEKAKLIEDMLRNEMERLNFTALNDIMERTVPIQGGAAFLVEWDNGQRTHTTIGELEISTVHPKQIVPQDGVYFDVKDMDYIILKLPQTVEYIKRRYKVDLKDEGEQEPQVRTIDAEAESSDEMVTQYVVYYRNDKGSIGLFSWVDDTILEDLEDYQARRLRQCTKCGAAEPADVEALDMPSIDGSLPGAIPGESLEDSMGILTGTTPKTEPKGAGKKVCPYCGNSNFREGEVEYEEVYEPITTSMGAEIPGSSTGEMATGDIDPDTGEPLLAPIEMPTRIPYYKPDVFPVILQKSVSMFGQLFGDSDVDKIESQQNTTNRLSTKILDKLIKSGSYMTLPKNADIATGVTELEEIRLDNIADMQFIKVHTMEGDIEQDMAYLEHVYEEARQVIGITDSFQGRKDTTATSGKAKEFAAAQTAGRLESKRIMKNSAYAQLFEAMFKFKLAYTDEARPVTSRDLYGDSVYKEFDRYDFLEQDEAGQWYWNDQFLFSCDTSAPLAANREAMWQETRMNFQSGTFGDPTQLDTQILFWSKMARLHYPDAEDTKAYLQEKLQREQERQEAMMEQQQMMMAQQQQQQMAPPGMMGPMEPMGEQARATPGIDEAALREALGIETGEAMPPTAVLE